MKLRGKTVVVTGASSGIGRETAREFARAGSNVVLASRNQKALEALAEELSALPGRRLVVPTDVNDREAVQGMVERTVQEFGSVHVLVNNAAIELHATIAEGKIENMRRVLEVNLFGVIHAVQAVVPHMKRQGTGTIINISSVSGRLVTPYSGIYCASKAALNAISDALRLELAEYGITVVTTQPGYTITRLHENAIRELEMPRPSRLLRGAPARAVAHKIVQAARHGGRDVFVTFGDRAAVALKELSPRLVDWGICRLWLSSRRPKRIGS